MSRSVLCVEHEPQVASWVGATLAVGGDDWVVRSATDLATATRAHRERPADVVLLDLSLPGSDGPLGCLDTVLRWSPTPAVVVLTVDEETAAVGRRAIDVGAQDYLDKRELTPSLLTRSLDDAHRRHVALTRESDRADKESARAEALSAYASAVSHDLRAPLVSLVSMVETIDHLLDREDALDGDMVARVRVMSSRAIELSRRALQFTDELLHDAEAGQAERVALDLDRLVVEAWQLVHRNHTNVALIVGELPGGVVGLPASIRQVFVNLFTNALRHVPADTGRILVEATHHGDHVLIMVHDNGPGVPHDQRTSVFAERVSHSGSTGIGLATVHRHLGRNGGRIWVEDSATLGGACFVLRLPAVSRPD